MLEAVQAQGYESPTPIQARCIPTLLEGRDLLGQAQTGTGKTAAFALPILCRLDRTIHAPQALVLTPTRELALQVAEAFASYATKLKPFRVLPVYGGQGIVVQLRQLDRGAHVVVGTPGRVMDHLRRGSLVLDDVKTLVLDEADEMLKMGFAEDIDEIFAQAPKERQVALFSATMPSVTKRVAAKHLVSPVNVKVESKTQTVSTIEQRHVIVPRHKKLDTITRILEVEVFDAMLIFARTKAGTMELTEKLIAHGFAAEALNGDLSQQLRERTVNRLRDGKLDIVVATDVAARGLDVERISHVVNYDIPSDPESYVHRIGRTGRAGREGRALLFVQPREKRLLGQIERTTKQRIPPMRVPTDGDLAETRLKAFTEQVTATAAKDEIAAYREFVQRITAESGLPAEDIAAAMAYLLQGERPLVVEKSEPPAWKQKRERRERPERPERRERPQRAARPERPSRPERPAAKPPAAREERPVRDERPAHEERRAPPASTPTERPSHDRSANDRPTSDRPVPERRERPEFSNDGPPRDARRERAERRRARDDEGAPTVRYKIHIGRQHGITPRQIVGAIANEAGLEGRHIGYVGIHDAHSTVDLPEGMPKEIAKHLRDVKIEGRALRLEKMDGRGNDRREGADRR